MRRTVVRIVTRLSVVACCQLLTKWRDRSHCCMQLPRLTSKKPPSPPRTIRTIKASHSGLSALTCKLADSTGWPGGGRARRWCGVRGRHQNLRSTSRPFPPEESVSLPPGEGKPIIICAVSPRYHTVAVGEVQCPLIGQRVGTSFEYGVLC